MKGKFSLVWRVVVALVLVLSFSLVAAVPAAAVNQDETPDYAKASAPKVKMLQFDISETATGGTFESLEVSYKGDALADVTTLYLLESNGAEVTSAPFTASPTALTFSEEIADGATVSYYLAVDIASDATDGNTVDIQLDKTGGTYISGPALEYNPAGSTTIDALAPTYDSAITGDDPDGDSTATTKVYLSFTEATSGLDPLTVVAGDFTVTGGANVDSAVITGDNDIILTLDRALATDATPTVDLVGSVSDKAGNSISAGSYVAADGLKPTMDSAELTSTTTIEVTFSEDLDHTTLLPGDFTVASPTVTVTGAEETAASIVELTLTSAISAGATPDVTVAAGSVEDLTGNKVVATTITATEALEPQVVSLAYIESSIAADPETLELTFNEVISIIGVPADYTVVYDTDGDLTDATDQRTVTPSSVASSGSYEIVTLTIPDQSTEDDPGGKFKVTVIELSHVLDQSANGVDSKAASANVEVLDFVDAGPQITSAVTKSLTTIEVTFSETLDETTVAAEDFTVDPAVGEVSSVTDNVVTLTLVSAMANTGITPSVAIGTGISDMGGTASASQTFENTADGVPPVLVSATTMTTTTIEVNFAEPLLTTSLDKAHFSTSVTIDSASVTDGIVTLTLETAIAGNATPPVTYTPGTLADTSGNSAESGSTTATDGISPVLESVSWTDEDGNRTIDEMDELVLTFSEEMDKGTLIGNLSLSLGTGPTVVWTITDTVATVILASGEDISAGDSLAPTTAVKDAAGVQADTTPVRIENLSAGLVLLSGVTTYSTIQLAINAAVSGDTITVGPGIYAEALNINKQVTLTGVKWDGSNAWTVGTAGADATAPTIVCDAPEDLININENNVTIQGFTIDLSGKANRGILPSTIDSPTIQYNTFTGANNTERYIPICDGFTVNNFTITYNVFTGPTSGEAVNWVTIGGNAGCSGANVVSHNITTGLTSAPLFLGSKNIEDITFSNNTLAYSIEFYGVGDCVGNFGDIVITYNTFGGYALDFLDSLDTTEFEGDAFTADDVIVQYNNFTSADPLPWEGCKAIYFDVTGSPADLNAENNYWGDPSGPTHVDNPSGTGGDVSVNVDYRPWLDAPYPDGNPITTLKAITLYSGWNLISLPLIPSNSDIEKVLAGAGADVTVNKVAGYSPFQDWRFYTPDFTSNLEQMNDGWGYWIDISGTGTLELTAYGVELALPGEVPPTYDVVVGWNLIGFTGTETDITKYLGPAVSNNLEAMYGYEAGTGYFIPGTLEHTTLESGLGYWLAVSAEGTIYP